MKEQVKQKKTKKSKESNETKYNWSTYEWSVRAKYKSKNIIYVL